MYPDSHQSTPSTQPALCSGLDALLATHYIDAGQITFLGMGTGNPHWLIATASGHYVWRQFSQTNPGVDREREMAVMQAIQGQHWAPELIGVLPGEGLLMREAPGKTMTVMQQDGMTLTDRQRTLILQAVIDCWQIREALPLCNLPSCSYADLIQQYAQLARQNVFSANEFNAEEFSAEELNVEQINALSEALLHECADWPTAEVCLTHHDLHPGNLLLTEDHCTLIDWEFASLGNPWLDAVMLDQMLTLTPAEKQQLEVALVHYPLPPLTSKQPWKALGHWKARFDQLWYLSLPSRE